MNFKKYIKRGIKYIVNGQPQKHITCNVAFLPPNELLKGRCALITGGTSGIGFSIAQAFINAGAKVIITGRSEERINKALESLHAGDNAYGITMDVSDVNSLENKFSDAVKYVGSRIDILINNAGIGGGHIKFTTEEEFDKIINTNLKGAFFLSKVVANYMKDNEINGNILNIASVSGIRPAVSAYMLSKSGIISLTKGLAKLLVPHGIVVNSIAPGATATPMVVDGESPEMYISNNPSQRMALPEEISNLAVVLVSDMGRMIVGDTIFMTGGAGVITYDDLNYNF